MEITEESILQSKVDWYKCRETPGNKFLNLKECKKPKPIFKKAIILEDGNERSSPDILLNNIKFFHACLCQRQCVKTESDCLNYLSNMNIPQESNEE